MNEDQIDRDISGLDRLLRQMPVTRTFVEACNEALPRGHRRMDEIELSPWWHAGHTPDTAMLAAYAMRTLKFKLSNGVTPWA